MLVPQSPRATRPTHDAYCTGSGSSRPSSARCAATCSGVAAAPSRRSAGSPGASRRSTKVRVTTPATTATPRSSWRTNRRPIGTIIPRHGGGRYIQHVIRRHRFLAASAPALVLAAAACGSVAERRGETVLFASGADLQSINPLLTVHPLARQVQRYVLFMTRAQYDSSLALRPYLAREWRSNPE